MDLIRGFRDLGNPIILSSTSSTWSWTSRSRVVLDHGVKIAEARPPRCAATDRVIEAYLGRRRRAA